MIALYLAMLERPEDAAAFIAIYEKFTPVFIRVGKRYFPDSWLLDDALQMSWERIAKNFVKISSLPRHETAPYLVTIMKNNCKTLLGQEKVHTEILPDEYPSSDEGLADTIYTKDECNRLVAHIRLLNDPYCETLERRLLMEQSNKEIARDMGISENLVAQRVVRGKKLLVEAMQKEDAHYE